MACQGLQIIERVHDIGKITIPAEILSKPGRLSEMEMNIVRTHAQQGYEGPALAEIESKAGRLYDREVVQACLRLFRQRGFSFDDREEVAGRAG